MNVLSEARQILGLLEDIARGEHRWKLILGEKKAQFVQ